MTTRFYYSFLDDNPRPDAAVIQALNEGASRIVVSEVFLTISNHTAEGKELIEALNVEETFGLPLVFTGPMYDSKTLQSMFVQRANAHIGDTDKSKVGILLVGHGQPDEWDVEWATETEQEIGFRQDVLEQLEAGRLSPGEPEPGLDGVQGAPTRGQGRGVCWRMAWKRCSTSAAAISADAIHSQWDIPALVNEARVPRGFPDQPGRLERRSDRDPGHQGKDRHENGRD